MRILAFERAVAGKQGDPGAPGLREEALRVWELYQSGVIRELYFRADRNQAVLILECRDENEARLTLATLPLVRDGYSVFDLISLRSYPGFARLFGRE